MYNVSNKLKLTLLSQSKLKNKLQFWSPVGNFNILLPALEIENQNDVSHFVMKQPRQHFKISNIADGDTDKAG